MAVLRISKKQQNFVILDKTCLCDSSLSWGAKGLHAYLMSLPDNWRVQVYDLQKRAKNGRDAVRGLLNELETAGYIKKSASRDEESGRFGGLEYMVLEIPEPNKEDNIPEPEMPSPVIPSPENPATGNPSPVKATLINNKNNNKLVTKTAAIECLRSEKETQEISQAAAVKKINSAKNTVVDLSRFQSKRPQSHSTLDLTIGSQLTEYQSQTVSHMVKQLGDQGLIQDIDRHIDEVTYVLLDLNQFKACGKDFNYKLNAIRLVMQRGDWRTPLGMKTIFENPKEMLLKVVSGQLSQSYADLRHFKGLHAVSQGELRLSYEGIIETTLLKIKKFEQEIEEQKIDDVDVAM